MDCPRCGSPFMSDRTACYEAVKAEAARARAREIVLMLRNTSQKTTTAGDLADWIESEYPSDQESS